MNKKIEERTNEDWMNNYLENLRRLSHEEILKAEEKNQKSSEDEETYKVIWK